MEKDEIIKHLIWVYNQQHYFIDRHDSMAEKFINVLLVEITALTIVFTLIIQSSNATYFHYIILLIFIILFSVTLIKLFLIIRPLSKKAINKKNEDIVKSENKNWIENSSIYYRGIIAQKKAALENFQSPFDSYIKNITDENIKKDLVQQIFILAQYSNYKRQKLEIVVKWVIITSLYGLLATILLILN